MERLTHIRPSSATEIYILQPSRLTQPQPSHAQHASLGEQLPYTNLPLYTNSHCWFFPSIVSSPRYFMVMQRFLQVSCNAFYKFGHAHFRLKMAIFWWAIQYFLRKFSILHQFLIECSRIGNMSTLELWFFLNNRFLWSYVRQSLILLFFLMLAKKVTLFINYVTLFSFLPHKSVVFY